MLSDLFRTRERVLLLILAIVEFFRCTLLPSFLEEMSNATLIAILLILLFMAFFHNCKPRVKAGRYEKMYNHIMELLLVCVILNCISCQIYRQQAYFDTFMAWAPILILYLYYPFLQFQMQIKDWEWVLQMLFLCVIFVHVFVTLFPDIYLFQMSSGYTNYLVDGRARAYSNVILWLGNIICFNKWMVKEQVAKNIVLFFVSMILIILTGYRIMLLADLVVCMVIFVKIKGLAFKNVVVGIFIVVFSLLIIGNSSMVRERWEEVMERNEEQNLDNEDYIRVVLVVYYYTEYFKSNWEMFFGSGMVERKFKGEGSLNRMISYPSKYSKEMSEQMTVDKKIPADVGLLGLSWEAGIPAVLLMVALCIILASVKQESKYLYIRYWGLFLLIISGLNPRYYYNHNLIYTVIVWVIFIQLDISKREGNSRQVTDIDRK